MRGQKTSLRLTVGSAIGLGVLLLLMPASAGAAVESLGAVFLPDLHPSFPWTEGAKGLENWYREDYVAAGLVRLSVRNGGPEAVSAVSATVDGRDYAAFKTIKGQPVAWWRMRPAPLPPGHCGIVEVRLREPPKDPLPVQVEFTDGQSLRWQVQPRQPLVRLGRICFRPGTGPAGLASRAAGEMAPPDPLASSDAAQVMLWCLAPRPLPGPLALMVDGKTIEPGDRLQVLGPWRSTLLLVYRPPGPLKYGSFHHYAVTLGGRLLDAAVVRTRDDFLPLGTYGYVTPRDYATNSLNLYVSFGMLGKGSLDNLAAYGIRGVTRVAGLPDGGEGPSSATRGHRDIWAYYLHDEPDCADYGVRDLPHKVRIGTHAMQMAARERNCYRLEPDKLTYLTLDQTYKPANWFHYGPIADVCATDHYPPPGREKDVFSTVETCRWACAPQMEVFIFRAWWPEPTKPREGQDRGRMMFAGEERLHLGWALAGGAQGFVCYIHCTERAGDKIFHGAGEFPDVWHAIGQMYREMGLVAPVLAAGWPVDGAVRAPDGVFARALAAPEGLVLVAINETGCRSTKDDFIARPARKVRLT
ncbi:MAG: hypothetical protein J7M26_03585, partial [Armatimonadetes bacterium]|nr:hypothetical protein [Armatimonadota bacterium]